MDYLHLSLFKRPNFFKSRHLLYTIFFENLINIL